MSETVSAFVAFEPSFSAVNSTMHGQLVCGGELLSAFAAFMTIYGPTTVRLGDRFWPDFGYVAADDTLVTALAIS